MKTAAIFDIDGTLLSGPSVEVRFVQYLVQRRLLRPADLILLPFWWARRVAADRSIRRTGRIYLAEKEVARVNDCVDSFFQQCVARHLRKKALATVTAHASQGRLILLLSGTLDFLLAPFQSLLRAHAAVGTRLEQRAGTFTGRLDGCNVSGAEKARRLHELQMAYDINLRRSYAYGDHHLDRYFLKMVGHPTAVNPSRQLRAWALAEEWDVTDWNN